MSGFISELKAAWVGNRRRKFYQSTRGIMTPEERRALEEGFDRKLAEHDRQVAEKAWAEGYRLKTMTLNDEIIGLLNPYSAEAYRQERKEK